MVVQYIEYIMYECHPFKPVNPNFSSAWGIYPDSKDESKIVDYSARSRSKWTYVEYKISRHNIWDN